MSSQLITTQTNVLCVSLLSWCNSGVSVTANSKKLVQSIFPENLV